MIGEQETLPLEKRKIQSSKNGIGQIIPALHKDWVEPREWMSYQVPPVGKDLEIVGAKEAWMERSIFVLDDLEFVLGLSYHMFWSQLVYDEDLQLNLSRLLRLLPRPHDRFSPHPDSDVRGILSDILRKTFLTFLRLSTHKESNVDFMGLSTFGQTIYDKFIFDIPKIMDIAVLFHSGNPILVEKMIGNIFRSQPSYESDLIKSVAPMGETVVKSVDKIEAFIQFSNCDNKKVLEGLLDLVTYTTDVIVSLHHLLKAYPKSAALIHKGVEQPLAGLYQNGLVPLQLYVRTQKETGLISEEIFEFLMSRILLARHSSLLAFRAITSTCCVTPALEDGHKANLGDEFLEALSSVISEPKFYQDYIKLFPLGDDLDIFNQAGLEVDPLRLQYLSQGGGSTSCPPGAITKIKKVIPPKFLTGDVVESEPSKILTAPSPEISSVEVDSLISQVRDLLPDLGEGFVERCLQYFDFVPEKVINALLEENLPPHLIELDRKKVRELKKLETTQPTSNKISDDILANRNNVFDGDEFDVNTQTSIDKSRIHRGKKKPFAKNANALLDDKKEIAGLKDKFAALSMVSDVVYDIDYDDEYDDTYDDNAMGEKEPDADELTERRPFVLPRALGGGHIEHVRQEESSEEDDDESEAKNRMNFARNPEEVRAESERRWNSKMAARGGVRTGPPPNRDVVGRAKGQGQDANVLRNRLKKTENKGKHIRNMADKKMSKGMF